MGRVDVPRTSDAWPMLGLIFMVDDVRPDNGATRFIPGSHHRTDPPRAVLADPAARHSDDVLACGPAGAVILFDTRSGGPCGPRPPGFHQCAAGL